MTSPVVDFRVRLPEEFRPTQRKDSPRGYTAQYEAVFGDSMAANSQKTLADLRAEMDAAGVDRAVIHNEYESGWPSDPADRMNEALARIVGDEPGRFAGFGCVSAEPFSAMRAYQQVGEIANLDLQGVTLEPAFHGMATDDRALYPAYARASDLGLPVALHAGVNYTLHRPIQNSHPLQIDQVACDFPDLVIIACHGGWPWIPEMVAVARKHPNVYIEFGGIAPKYVTLPGTGWEVMHRFMNSLLAGRVLHGTDWPVISMARALGEWREAGLKPDVLNALLGANATRLLASLPGQPPG